MIVFRFHLISDTDSSSGVLEAKQKIASNEFYKVIESDSYGHDLNGIVIVLMCREPGVFLKQRLRLSKKEKILYFDIMLDFDTSQGLSNDQLVSEICKTILMKVPPVVEKYKFKDFHLEKFMANLKCWFELNELIFKN